MPSNKKPLTDEEVMNHYHEASDDQGTPIHERWESLTDMPPYIRNHWRRQAALAYGKKVPAPEPEPEPMFTEEDLADVEDFEPALPIGFGEPREMPDDPAHRFVITKEEYQREKKVPYFYRVAGWFVILSMTFVLCVVTAIACAVLFPILPWLAPHWDEEKKTGQ